ncbi:hypothetical protein [Virgibacillus sp. Bac332]|uniref:hypothetical protein n=1 Tax=Virgibacillus sp. Bac332 TaxID=2419842 RepID=UPI000EF4FD81|nr:hypothetical protein [Virgibacillus sp. Bac332]
MISFWILIYLLSSCLSCLIANEANKYDVDKYGSEYKISKKKLILIGFVMTPASIIGVLLISYLIVSIEDTYNWFVTYLP